LDATEREIEEERRLAYVGVTRAQEHLTLTNAEARRKWGKLRKSLPSRFLAEMQDDEPGSAANTGAVPGVALEGETEPQ
jgi:superfamily I DNA/RNA helicase